MFIYTSRLDVGGADLRSGWARVIECHAHSTAVARNTLGEQPRWRRGPIRPQHRLRGSVECAVRRCGNRCPASRSCIQSFGRQLALPSGKRFVISAPNNSASNLYIPIVTHAQIEAGGLLEFDMGPAPSKWAAGWRGIPLSQFSQ
jgi:hypothetical protein